MKYFDVPMDGNIVLDVVDHFDQKAITFSGYDARSWKLTIYCYNALCVTKSCHILQFDLQKQ